MHPSARIIFGLLLMELGSGACAPGQDQGTDRPKDADSLDAGEHDEGAEPEDEKDEKDEQSDESSTAEKESESQSEEKDKKQEDADGEGEKDEKSEAKSEKKDDDPLASLVGDYRLAGGKSGIDDAIEEVVSQMSVISRGIARRRLKDANKAPAKVSVKRSGDKIRIELDGRSYEAVPDGSRVSVKTSTGESAKMRYQIRNGKLHQTFDVGEGDRTNVFAKSGKGITMSVRIKSSKLPADVTYRLSYN